MKLKKKQQEFIRDMVERWGIRGDYRKEIKEAFPKLFEKDSYINDGDWVFNGNRKTLFRYNKEDNRTGFDAAGDWCNDIGTRCDAALVKAEESQIFQRLTAEAEKRGIRERTYPFVECLSGWHKRGYKYEFNSRNISFKYYKDSDTLLLMNKSGFNYLVYRKGEWAKLSKPKKMTLSEIENKLGHPIEIV